jgi:iron complex transport system ATP-binding protein
VALMERDHGYRLSDAGFSYGRAHAGLQALSLHLAPGCFYGLLGPNGSGKTTLLDLLAGHLTPSCGSVLLNGRQIGHYPPPDRARLLTSVPQSFSLNFDYCVYDVVLMGRHPHIPRFARPSRDDHTAVEQALAAMEIDQFRDRSVRQLSGGEKQRVMIARALAQDTDYLLLDEVTANLDINHALAIMKLLARLVRQGRTVIAALHDLNIALAFCDQVVVLKDGKLCCYGPTEDIVTPALVADLYEIEAESYRTAARTNQISFIYR